MPQVVKVIVGVVGKAVDMGLAQSSMEPATMKGKNTDAAPPFEITSDLNDDQNWKQRSEYKRLPSSDNLPDVTVFLVKKEVNAKEMNNIAERSAAKVKKIFKEKGRKKGLNKGYKREYKKGPKKEYINTGPHIYKKVGFNICLMILSLCVISVTAPYCMAWFGYDMNPEYVLNFPLKNASLAPAVISYKLSEGHIFRGNGFSGLIFYHDDLVSGFDYFFSHFGDIKPLLPLIDTDYDILTECPRSTVNQYYMMAYVFWGNIFLWIVVIMLLCGSSKKCKAVSANKTSCMFTNLDVVPAIVMVLIYLVLLGGPIFNEGNESRNLLNFPLKNTSFAPAYMTYQYGDAYVLRRENFFGVVFSHDDLVAKFGNCLNGSERLTPLLPLVHPGYKGCNMQVNISAVFPLLISVSFGVLFYSLYLSFGFGVILGKNYPGIFLKKNNFKSANLKLEFERQPINI